MRSTTRRASTAFVALALLATACGDGDGDTEPTDDGTAADGGEAAADLELVNEGTLTVCSDIPYEPFEFEDPDSDIGYSGFDIELIQAIAERADLDVEVTVTGFEALTSGTAMATGQCDVAASAMTITEERAEQIDFSEPYYEALQSLLVMSDSGIASIDDLEGTVVGVQSGTTGEMYAQENVEGAEIRAFENPGDLFVALDSGQIDAVLQDLPVNAERARDTDELEVVEEYDTDENYGFALEQDRADDLLQVINDGLGAVRDDGTYEQLYDKYFATE
ncbi:basic amino acid ABC transporter substrate-binding protein [Nitriliruptor alkaliphilus]|uniref:basic amino acid ABC transporter substrate-binding protein n=1 Tax=Nitriliruptor alkaliphilus TaxID=427918 RepID=UPI000697AA76|nr:basic amino acid ABC transporter substrate-binding protein [Nitriliruptor alkaliphilus]